MDEERLKRLGLWHMRLYHLNPEELGKELVKNRRQFEEEMKEMSLALAELAGPANPGESAAPQAEKDRARAKPPGALECIHDHLTDAMEAAFETYTGEAKRILLFMDTNIQNMPSETPGREEIRGAVKKARDILIKDVTEFARFAVNLRWRLRNTIAWEAGEPLRYPEKDYPVFKREDPPMSSHVAATLRNLVAARPDEFPAAHEGPPPPPALPQQPESEPNPPYTLEQVHDDIVYVLESALETYTGEAKSELSWIRDRIQEEMPAQTAGREVIYGIVKRVREALGADSQDQEAWRRLIDLRRSLSNALAARDGQPPRYEPKYLPILKA